MTVTASEMNKNILIFKEMTQGLLLTRMAEFPDDTPPALSDINYIIRSPHLPPSLMTCPWLPTARIIQIPPEGPQAPAASQHHLTGAPH